ncbi:Serine/threonine-protein kinase AfsK [Nonomuraea coxensis DSM 45129]|uniref:Serine/threonine-protein kinase AfsK n=1 Tax=Nonomuraea coxensis DSM 45129 TaxID=1122611 RepID=A0ABX8TZI8_9ACTN|nr:glycoside hydrolase family 6 protein [Nonomuraea coxensis]QYC39793.1 Serine/threonine-protein kinase AfsK [Nonomuraea coxensis DSM 45129]
MTLDALRDGDPRQAGPYTLLGRLGEGGMGTVYLGRAPDGTRVAVKLITARMSADPGFRRRFAREVAAARRVARFCTAPVLDADVEGDPAYLVTEYVEGPSLGEAVRASGPLTGSALDGLAAAMAVALRAIHGAGVVHRDLKPSNVLLSQVGPKVIDFGIARFTETEVSSAIVGTPAYMSPEQVSGSRVGPASDIFSWGCTVAFAASGASPFGSGSVPTILLRIVNEAPELHGLSGVLRELVEAATAKNPAQRPTAQDLLDRLSAANPTAQDLLAQLSAADPPASVESPGTPGAGGAAGVEGAGSRARADVTEPGVAFSGPTRPAPAHSDGTPGLSDGGGRRRGRVVAGAAAAAVAVAGVAVALVWNGVAGSGGDGGALAGSTSSAVASRASGQGDPRATATGTTGTGTATPGGDQAAGGGAGNPLRAARPVAFYSPEEPNAARQADLWKKDRPQDAALMEKLAKVPHAIRLGSPEVRAKVADAVANAAGMGGVPVFLVNYLPGTDECRPATPAELAAYQSWIKGIAGQIGSSPAVVVLEPGSLTKLLGTKNCDPQGSPDQRYAALREAAGALKANPRTAVYLDGAQDLYPGTEIMAERLVKAGVDKTDGFFLNAASYQRTEKAVGYGKQLSACIALRRAGRSGCPLDAAVDRATLPHFVVDTARNGRGSWAPVKHYADPQTWCNPPGKGVGDRPTTETGEELADAYLWIARPGTSSGHCRRGTNGDKDPEWGVVAPKAGEWWAELALERAKLADPPWS